ncbi:MAG: glutamate 5-kinase [Deltaproteobacteria bacterium]|nr:glutamate 5-kinase [Deltaproteobacteria bacterium]
MSQTRKQIVSNVRKALIKIGTGVLAGTDGLDLSIVEQLVDEMVELRAGGMQIVIVTSGAIASGKHRMGITGKLKSMPQKQACAAIGQGRLMRIYSNAFGRHSVYVAQILLTMSDLTDRARYINIRNTLSTLMDWNIVPIINENDTVSVDEIKFGDNDHLAAMIANVIRADILINLTNTEGLFDRNPVGKQRARLIKIVHEITDEIESMATAEADPVGMGGMRSKVIAARKVTACGIPYIIARGKTKGILADVFAGKEKGTLFLPSAEPMTSREYWIAFTLRSRGKLILDDGAKNAIVTQGKSLLPSGITKVEGDFEVGDPVICIGTDGKAFAKGLVNYGSKDLVKIQGLKTAKIMQVLGYKDYDEVIHRDNMAVAKGSRKT